MSETKQIETHLLRNVEFEELSPKLTKRASWKMGDMGLKSFFPEEAVSAYFLTILERGVSIEAYDLEKFMGGAVKNVVRKFARGLDSQVYSLPQPKIERHPEYPRMKRTRNKPAFEVKEENSKLHRTPIEFLVTSANTAPSLTSMERIGEREVAARIDPTYGEKEVWNFLAQHLSGPELLDLRSMERGERLPNKMREKRIRDKVTALLLGE